MASETVEEVSHVETTESSNNKETFAFNADINQLLSLIINTFYSNKDVFLRELISNSSDALDKLRYQSLTDKSVLESESELRIRLLQDRENKRLVIEDTGIGMTRNDLINNLGTIAKSGTKAFMEALKAGDDVSMIGQFGVGFYSAYLVADKVTVISKSNDEDTTYCWVSKAGGTFEISEATEDQQLTRGTRIVLDLKDDQYEFLEEVKIKDLVKTHSQFIDFPIQLQCEKTKDVEVTDDDEPESTENNSGETENNEVDKKEDGSDNEADGDSDNEDDVQVEDVTDEKEEDTKKKTKTVTEKYMDWDHLNEQRPIWTRKSSEVTKEEYTSFYKSISNDWEEPLAYKHFSVEGQIEFKGVLFIPKRPPHTMFEQTKNKCDVKLYVRRVFITDDYKELIPEYLSFMKGVVDSEDLPLNISREMLQQNKIMRVIRKNISKKCIELFTEVAEDETKFGQFYQHFAKNLKLGVYEDAVNREKLSKLLRFYSSSSTDKMVSLDTYVERMKEGQTTIYYIAGESVQNVNNSPCMEMIRANGIEVLYFVDPIDEYMIQQFKQYDGKEFVCVTKENLNLNQTDEEKAKYEEETKALEGVCTKIKEVLESKIEKVVVSQRLSDSPCILVTTQHGWSANMERILKAQALRDTSMDMMMGSKKIMEINPTNKTIRKIKELVGDKDSAHTVNDLIWLMYESATLASGFALENPAMFTKRINRLIELGLSIDGDDEDDNSKKDADLDEIIENTDINDLDDTADAKNTKEEEESTMEEVD